MTRLIKGQWTNGRRSYVTEDGRFYAFFDPESRWSVGRVVDGQNYHVEDVRSLREARVRIAALEATS